MKSLLERPQARILVLCSQKGFFSPFHIRKFPFIIQKQLNETLLYENFRYGKEPKETFSFPTKESYAFLYIGSIGLDVSIC